MGIYQSTDQQLTRTCRVFQSGHGIVTFFEVMDVVSLKGDRSTTKQVNLGLIETICEYMCIQIIK